MKQTQTNNGRIVLSSYQWVETPAAKSEIVPTKPQKMTVGNYDFSLSVSKTGGIAYEFDSQLKVHGLKLFEVHGDKMTSTHYPADGSMPVEYKIGWTYRERVQAKRNGFGGAGHYIYLTTNLQHFMTAFHGGYIVTPGRDQQYAVAYCQAMGPFVAYDVNGCAIPNTQIKRAKKLAASWLRVEEIVHTFWN